MEYYFEHYFDGIILKMRDDKYWTLSGEISGMTMHQLNEAIEGIEAVFDGKWQRNSFCGQHMSTVDYDKDLARIEYFDGVIGEEPTLEIYNMLKEYRHKLQEYEDAR